MNDWETTTWLETTRRYLHNHLKNDINIKKDDKKLMEICTNIIGIKVEIILKNYSKVKSDIEISDNKLEKRHQLSIHNTGI